MNSIHFTAWAKCDVAPLWRLLTRQPSAESHRKCSKRKAISVPRPFSRHIAATLPSPSNVIPRSSPQQEDQQQASTIDTDLLIAPVRPRNLDDSQSSTPPQSTSSPPPPTINGPVTLPVYLKMSPEDEKYATIEGFFVQRLIDAGLIHNDGRITDLGRSHVNPMSATVIHLIINKMLSMSRRYQTVLAVMRDIGSYMGPVNLATGMHRLGRLVRFAKVKNPLLPERIVYHPQYQYMLKRAEELVDSMTPRTMANFLWGMAAIRDQRNTGIVLRLGQRLMNIDPGELKTQELSNVVWSLATLEMRLPDLMDRMLNSACDRIDECVPQALSNMIWACATLSHEHPRFMEAVAASATPRLRTFQSQTLANTLWAYSVLGIYPPELFNKAAEEITWRLVERKHYAHHAHQGTRSEDDSGGMSSMSDTGSSSEDDAVGSVVPSLISTMYPPSPSRTGESVPDNDTMLPPPRQSPTGRNNSASDDNRFDFRGQEISNVLIAYARGSIIHPGLLDTLEKDLCSMTTIFRDGEYVQAPRLQEFTSQALANTLWAYASLRWYPAQLLPCITEAIAHIIHTMTGQEIANSLWAYARFAYHPGRVLSSFLAIMERRIDDFEGQGCTNSLWALAVLKASHSNAFVGLLQRYIILEKNAGSFGELQYNQVLQAALLAQFEARGGRIAWRPEIDLPEQVVDRALAAWASQQTSTQLSGFHLDVSEGLTQLGISHCIEYLVARDLLSIDIAVTKDGRQIAIEVDGPFHFPVNARTPLGHTMIRRRLLRAAGWTVVSIPWYEWFGKETWEERLSYLAMVLGRADESLVQQVRPTVRELLSTEFLPGPGLDTNEEDDVEDAIADVSSDDTVEGDMDDTIPSDLEESALSTAQATTQSPTRKRKEDSISISQNALRYQYDDGPVLSYSTTTTTSSSHNGGVNSKDVNNGLMEVLSRPNLLLTEGAIRRLQSMGLDDVVKHIEERKRNSSRRGRKTTLSAAATSSRVDMTYAPPPSMGNDDTTLLPKPSREGRGEGSYRSYASRGGGYPNSARSYSSRNGQYQNTGASTDRFNPKYFNGNQWPILMDEQNGVSNSRKGSDNESDRE